MSEQSLVVCQAAAIPSSVALAEDANGQTRPDPLEPSASSPDSGNDRTRTEQYEIRRIPLNLIVADHRVQARAKVVDELVDEYAQAMMNGVKFPPLVVFKDGDRYLVGDGFHRRLAALRVELIEFECEIRPGGLREASLFAAGANATHGRQRTSDDKRRAVMKLLEDEEWNRWTDHEIARQCHVSHQLVGKLRSGLTGRETGDRRKYRNKHGKVTVMNTGNIRKSKAKRAAVIQVSQPTRVAAADTLTGETGSPVASVAEKLGAENSEARQAGDDTTPDAHRLLRDLVNFVAARSAYVERTILITIAEEDISGFDRLLDRAKRLIGSPASDVKPDFGTMAVQTG